MKFDYLHDMLDEQEQTYVQQFMDNEKMRESVRKVLLAGIYENGILKKGKRHWPTINFLLGFDFDKLKNEELGEQLRANYEAIRLLETAFSNMAKFKTEEPRSETENQAR